MRFNLYHNIKKKQDLKKNICLYLFHYYKAKCHFSQKSFSPDLSPCEFGLFCVIKNGFKGHTFDTEKELLEVIDIFF